MTKRELLIIEETKDIVEREFGRDNETYRILAMTALQIKQEVL